MYRDGRDAGDILEAGRPLPRGGQGAGAAGRAVRGDQPALHPAPRRGRHRPVGDEDQPPGDGGGRLAAVRRRLRDLCEGR